jgi:hypothetical protein
MAVEVVSSTKPLTLIAPADLVMAPGSERVVTISGGAAPYKATTSNDQVVGAQVSGQSLTLKAPPTATGDAVVTVSDKNDVKVLQNVKVSFVVQPLTVQPTDLTLPVELPGGAKVKILGGLPPYRVISGLPAAVDAVVVPASDATGYEVEITPKLVSKFDLVIYDSANQTATVKIEVNNATTSIRVSPSAMTVAYDFAGTLDFGVFGAVGDVKAFLSSDARATATVKVDAATGKKSVAVDLSAGGLVIDNAGKTCALNVGSITLTVVDANSSIGTAVINRIGPTTWVKDDTCVY